MLDMTGGEWGLFLFIFALIYGAPWVPRAGRAVGRALSGGRTTTQGVGSNPSDGEPSERGSAKRGTAEQEPS